MVLLMSIYMSIYSDEAIFLGDGNMTDKNPVVIMLTL